MKFKVTSTTKGKEEWKQIVARCKDARAWLTRVAYRMYQEWQLERWQTENASQGAKWKRLNPSYAEYKLKRYGGGPKYMWIGGRGKNRPWKKKGKWPSYPGKGTKMMIATGTLVNSVTGKKLDFHRRVVRNKALAIGTTVPYAKDANELRDFTKFKEENIKLLFNMYQSYVMTGRV